MQMELFTHKPGTMQLYRSILSGVTRRFALTQMQLDVLLFLANNPQYDTARDLVEVRHLSKSHVSAAVDDLVQRGFLLRQQKAGNKKLIHLRLLPAADEVIRAGQAAQQDFFEQLFVGFTPAERTQLTELLSRVETNAEEAFHRLEHQP